MHAVFRPSQPHKGTLGLECLPRNNTRGLLAYHLMWGYLSLFCSIIVTLIYLSICHMACGHSHKSICPFGGGTWCLSYGTNDVGLLRLVALHQMLRLPTDHGGQMLFYQSQSCSFSLYVSQTLFHPVLDCVMESLVTSIPRCNGQRCMHPFPKLITHAQYSLHIQ